MEVAAEARALLGDGARAVEGLLPLLGLDVEDLEQLHRQHAQGEPDQAPDDLERQARGVEPAAGVADPARRHRAARHDQPGHDGVAGEGGRGGRRVGPDAGHARGAELAALAPEPDRRQDRAGEQQRVAGERHDRGLPLRGAPPGGVGGQRAAGDDRARDHDGEAGQRAAQHRAQAEQPQPELHQEEEGRDLDDAAQHHQALDDALAEVALLDRDERVAPDGEGLDEGEAGQPDQRRRERQAGRAPALEPDGEAEGEEDQPLREQDDGLVLNEELAHVAPSGGWRKRRGGRGPPRSPPAARISGRSTPSGADCSAAAPLGAPDDRLELGAQGGHGGLAPGGVDRPRAPPGAPGGGRGCCG